jgi:hypothetical protein
MEWENKRKQKIPGSLPCPCKLLKNLKIVQDRNPSNGEQKFLYNLSDFVVICCLNM